MRQIISTGKGPNAIGPYSQAVRGGQFIFVSGQISLDPATQKIIDGDISQQTERVLQSIAGILEAGGAPV
jgi:2-iminobutanoate/2-iminopropanoate deaminase